MAFSRTFKASLVAMVLFILTAVDRLDAAPMYRFSNSMPGWTKEAEEAVHLGAKPVDLELQLALPVEDDGLDLSLGSRASGKSVFPSAPTAKHRGGAVAPPAEDDGLDLSLGSRASGKGVLPSARAAKYRGGAGDYVGPSYPTSYAQSTGVQQAGGQHVRYGEPSFDPSYSILYERPGVSPAPNWQGGGQHMSYSRAGFDPSHSTSTRNEGHAASTSGGSHVAMPLEDPTGYAAKTPARSAGQTVPNEDPRLIFLRGEQWRNLGREAKSEYLNSVGKEVFSSAKFRHLSVVPGHSAVRYGGDLHRQLVEEYLKLRWNPTLERKYTKRVQFLWLPDRLPKPSFFNNARSTSIERTRNGFSPTTSALVFDENDPLQPLSLGGFEVKVHRDRKEGARNDPVWKGLTWGIETPTINVIALTNDLKRKIYVGQAMIWLNERDITWYESQQLLSRVLPSLGLDDP